MCPWDSPPWIPDRLIQGWLEVPILDSYYDKLKSQFLKAGHHSLSMFIKALRKLRWLWSSEAHVLANSLGVQSQDFTWNFGPTHMPPPGSASRRPDPPRGAPDPPRGRGWVVGGVERPDTHMRDLRLPARSRQVVWWGDAGTLNPVLGWGDSVLAVVSGSGRIPPQRQRWADDFRWRPPASARFLWHVREGFNASLNQYTYYPN